MSNSDNDLDFGAFLLGTILGGLVGAAAALLGVQPAAPGQSAASSEMLRRFCVISKHNRKWVFPADEVYGLGSYAQNDVQPVPVNVAKTLQKYTLGIIAVNKRQTGLINDELVFAAFERSLA